MRTGRAFAGLLLALALVCGGGWGCEGDGGAGLGGADGGGGDDTRRLEDTAGADEPALVLQAGELTFAEVLVGEDGTQTIVLLNPTAATVLLARVALEGDPAFAVEVSGETLAAGPASGNDLLFVPPLTIAPGDTVSLTIVFTRSSPAAAAATLRLYAEGAAAPVGVLELSAPALATPTLLTAPEALDFGVVTVGQSLELQLHLLVAGEAPVTVEAFAFDESASPAFALGGETPAAPFTLLPNQSGLLSVVYAPAACPAEPQPPAPDTAVLRIALADGGAPVTVPLTGICAADDGPTDGWVVVAEGPRVLPQTVLHLSLAGAEAASFEWRVDQPAGSQSLFVPSPNVPTPTFVANVAGTYRFSLVTHDADGAELPRPTSGEVWVLPEAALHVELLWTTPGDEDETDEGPNAGADLDLHLVHPDAPADPAAADRDGDGAPDPWFDPALDCYWFNPAPDWGVPGYDRDDPSLDRDDVGGAGPENVNLYELEEGARYRLAVHYWRAQEFGASFATVRVYFDGALAWSVENVRLIDHDLWYVADVDVATRTVVPCESEGACVTPDYQPADLVGE